MESKLSHRLLHLCIGKFCPVRNIKWKVASTNTASAAGLSLVSIISTDRACTRTVLQKNPTLTSKHSLNFFKYTLLFSLKQPLGRVIPTCADVLLWAVSYLCGLYRSLETPDTSCRSCVTARCVQPPEVGWTQRCHGSGRAGSRDFIHQWPWVLHYPLPGACVCVCVCVCVWAQEFLRTRGRTASHASSSRKTPREKRNERERERSPADMLDISGLQFAGQADWCSGGLTVQCYITDSEFGWALLLFTRVKRQVHFPQNEESVIIYSLPPPEEQKMDLWSMSLEIQRSWINLWFTAVAKL